MQSQIACGLYRSASEVIRAGLFSLKNAKMTHSGNPLPLTLEADLIQSLDQLECGKGQDAADVFNRLKSRTTENSSGA